MHYVYILYSAKLDKFYIGSTKDPRGRLRRHLSASKGFTAQTRDWKLVYTEPFANKSKALARERQLKKWKNPTRIWELILSKPND